MERYWFKAKQYGYGWYPATWEGWVVMIVWFVAFVRLALVFANQVEDTGDPLNLVWFLPLVFIITAALLWVCWLKGEPARWRWGNDKKR